MLSTGIRRLSTDNIRMNDKPIVNIGIPGDKYKHFKGGIYEIIGNAKHSETDQDFIVYTDESGEIWVQPSLLFFGNFRINDVWAKEFGKRVNRFSLITDQRTTG